MADIFWWHLFVSTWNGISMLWDLGKQSVDFTVTSQGHGAVEPIMRIGSFILSGPFICGI